MGRKRRVNVDVHSTKIIKVPAYAKPLVQVKAEPVKRTFTRFDLPDGDFLMNYYYVMDYDGRLIPEDIARATHFERVVYDRDGNVIGSTIGKLNDRVKW